jgi:hypothetical protein
MNGRRMNQFVAPTSFITDTSRRRAKMAMRMVLRISTAADTKSTSATRRNTHWRISMTCCSVRIWVSGALTTKTPACPWNSRITAVASCGWTGVHRHDVGVSFGVTPASPQTDPTRRFASKKSYMCVLKVHGWST